MEGDALVLLSHGCWDGCGKAQEEEGAPLREAWLLLGGSTAVVVWLIAAARTVAALALAHLVERQALAGLWQSRREMQIEIEAVGEQRCRVGDGQQQTRAASRVHPRRQQMWAWGG